MVNTYLHNRDLAKIGAKPETKVSWFLSLGILERDLPVLLYA